VYETQQARAEILIKPTGNSESEEISFRRNLPVSSEFVKSSYDEIKFLSEWAKKQNNKREGQVDFREWINRIFTFETIHIRPYDFTTSRSGIRQGGECE
jgi:hypothetical protein